MKQLLTLLFLLQAACCLAQGPVLDPAFIIGQVYTPGDVRQAVQQADGKRLLVGQFSRVASTDVATAGYDSMVRLLAGGTQLDASFQANTAGLQGDINKVLPLANGKLLVVGVSNFTLQLGAVSRMGLLRLNADGTPDATFTANTSLPTVSAQAVVEQPNGKLIVAGTSQPASGTATPAVVRLNADGSPDPSFQVTLNAGTYDVVETVLLQPDGNIIIGGVFSTGPGQPRRPLARLLPTGVFDTSFSPVLPANTTAGSLALQADGKLLALLGSNGSRQLQRLLPTGAADATWQPGTGFTQPGNVIYFGPLALQTDGNILVSTSATLYNGAPIGRLVRLLPSGALDASFANQTAAPVAERYPSSVQALPGGQVLAAGYPLPYGSAAAQPGPLAVLTAAGIPLPAAVPAVQMPGSISDVARLPNGQLLVGGNFNEINGQTANNVARLNANGTPDATFTTACNGVVNSVVVQADGKILLGGGFSNAAGAARAGLVRLLSTGALDAAFVPPLQPASTRPFSDRQAVRQLVVQPDGNILISGYFNLRASAAVPQVLARVLGTTGQRDATFVPADSTGGFTLRVQPDGKILVGGVSLTLVPGNILPVLAWRLLPSGALDPSFALTPVNSSRNTTMTVDDYGRVYVANKFTTFGAVPTTDVARLLPNGTPDASFVANISGTLYLTTALVVQPNGRVLVGADITRGGIDEGLTRLLPDGSEDLGFLAASQPGQEVARLVVQPDGAIIVAGSFQQVGNLPVGGLVRLLDSNVLAVIPHQPAAQFNAWPVPAHGTLYLHLDTTARPQQVELLDALGRIVRSQPTPLPDLTLATDGLPAGVYLLRVTYGAEVATRRVVLE